MIVIFFPHYRLQFQSKSMQYLELSLDSFTCLVENLNLYCPSHCLITFVKNTALKNSFHLPALMFQVRRSVREPSETRLMVCISFSLDSKAPAPPLCFGCKLKRKLGPNVNLLRV